MHWKVIIAGFMGLLVIWGLGLIGMKASRDRQVTVDKVIAKVHETPLATLQGQARQEYLAELGQMVNGLDFENRRELGLRRGLDLTFEVMNLAERQDFLNQTLPQGFQQIIERFNQMEPDERQAAVERAMSDLQQIEMNATWEERQRTKDRLEDGTLKQVINQGFEAYLKSASAETKLDLAPLIEQIQRNMQGLGYR
ncbi:MAG: hypothetical protein AAF558_01080 [Verrucomicrobiota bacterium]